MILSVLENTVNYTKRIIKGFLCFTPYRGKIEKNAYLLIEHTTFFIFGSLTFYDRDWLYDLSMMWKYNFEWSIYIYYYLYFARYCIQIKHLEKETHDYYTMLTHHIMTIILLASSAYRYTRIGIIIALSHDIADIFLNFAKITNKMYAVSKKDKYTKLSNISLICFFFSWLSTRMFLNFNILTEIYTHKNLNFNVFLYDTYIDEKIAFILLLVNFILQSFWQILIINFIYNILIGKKGIDEKGQEYKVTN